jgi:hypothetical protein
MHGFNLLIFNTKGINTWRDLQHLHTSSGVEIDPESLLAQYRSGVPEQQLMAMPEGPASPLPREHGMS